MIGGDVKSSSNLPHAKIPLQYIIYIFSLSRKGTLYQCVGNKRSIEKQQQGRSNNYWFYPVPDDEYSQWDCCINGCIYSIYIYIDIYQLFKWNGEYNNIRNILWMGAVYDRRKIPSPLENIRIRVKRSSHTTRTINLSHCWEIKSQIIPIEIVRAQRVDIIDRGGYCEEEEE